MKSFCLAAIDMGYGHLRPAYALKERLGVEVLHADQAPLAEDTDRALWSYVRRYYEGLSRASQWPIVGPPMRSLLERATDIEDLYSARDQTRPSLGSYLLEHMIQKGLGRTLVDYLERRDGTLVTTFFVPAIAADRLGYDKIFCIVTDSDINRVWAPLKAGSTRIVYLVPSQRARRRLRAYGVPEGRIRVTGFPLPHELVGGTELSQLKPQLARRLVRLDPTGQFRADLKHAIKHFLGPLPELADHARVPRLTFAVGGAGAQLGLVDTFLPSLRGLVANERLRITLVAGIRGGVAERLRRTVEQAGLSRYLGSGVEVLLESTFPRYLAAFSRVLSETDVLWTKPSEMTFFAGLGLPLIFSEPVGTHEQSNRRWAREAGAGLKQRQPRFAGAWLNDWLKDGTLAGAAWNGFTRLPTYGLYQILEALGVENQPRAESLQGADNGVSLEARFPASLPLSQDSAKGSDDAARG